MHSINVTERGRFQRVLQAIILSSAIVLPATLLWVIDARNSEAQLIAIEWPDHVGNSSRVSDVEKSETLSYFPKATVSESRFFEVERQYVRVDAFVYDLRDKTAELIGYPNQWFDGDNWRVLRRHSIGVAEKSAHRGPRVLQLQSRSRAVVLAGGYLIDDVVTGNNVEAKIVGTLGLLREQAAGAAVFATMDCKDDCRDEEQIVSEFFRSLLGSSSFGLRIEPME